MVKLMGKKIITNAKIFCLTGPLYVCFSGYSHVKGQVLQAEDAECLYEGLKQNKINGQFSHLLTGILADILPSTHMYNLL